MLRQCSMYTSNSLLKRHAGYLTACVLKCRVRPLKFFQKGLDTRTHTHGVNKSPRQARPCLCVPRCGARAWGTDAARTESQQGTQGLEALVLSAVGHAVPAVPTLAPAPCSQPSPVSDRRHHGQATWLAPEFLAASAGEPTGSARPFVACAKPRPAHAHMCMQHEHRAGGGSRKEMRT